MKIKLGRKAFDKQVIHQKQRPFLICNFFVYIPKRRKIPKVENRNFVLLCAVCFKLDQKVCLYRLFGTIFKGAFSLGHYCWVMKQLNMVLWLILKIFPFAGNVTDTDFLSQIIWYIQTCLDFSEVCHGLCWLPGYASCTQTRLLQLLSKNSFSYIPNGKSLHH